MIGKKYSVEYKEEMVQKYLKAKEKQPLTTIVEFANENELPVSTFYDWLMKHRRREIGFCNITNEIKKITEIDAVDSTPLETQKVDSLLPNNKVKITYKGAVIELDDSLLERAMNILRSW